MADAGATVSLIKGKTAKELKLNLYPSDLEATGVNGVPIDISWRVAVKVQLGSSLVNQCFHVANDIAQDVLLGADFLEKLGDVTYNFSKCQLKIGHDVIPMGGQKGKHKINMVSSHKVRVVASVHIPPLSEVAVLAEIDSSASRDDSVYFEGDSTSGPRHLMFTV